MRACARSCVWNAQPFVAVGSVCLACASVRLATLLVTKGPASLTLTRRSILTSYMQIAKGVAELAQLSRRKPKVLLIGHLEKTRDALLGRQPFGPSLAGAAAAAARPAVSKWAAQRWG